MNNRSPRLLQLLMALSLLIGFTLAAQAEEGTIKILAPWEGTGAIYKVGPNQFQTVGAFEGIMYVETEQGEFHTAIMVCPAVQDIDMDKEKAQTSGRCHIVAPRGNVYAEFKCSGVIGSCKGKFKLTGGTDELEGITGSGEMHVQTAVGAVAADVASGQGLRQAKGLAIWPSLKYRIPEKK